MSSSGREEDYEQLARGLTWEELPVGRRFETGARTVTEADLVSFVGAMGLYEPLFMDANEGFPAGGRSGRLVPGLLALGIAEGLVVQTNMIQGTGMALLSLHVEMRGPVFVGDTIRVRLEITESRATSKPGRGIVGTRNEIVNQENAVVIAYEPVRMIAGDE
jgi:acyl dehydratase